MCAPPSVVLWGEVRLSDRIKCAESAVAENGKLRFTEQKSSASSACSRMVKDSVITNAHANPDFAIY